MTALNFSICHPTGIQRQYIMPSATNYAFGYNILPPPQAEDQYSPGGESPTIDGAQTVENQTILVGGVYHR